MKKVFHLKGLDCPNCSAMIEREVGELDGVETSVVNLMNQTLTINVDSSSLDEVTKKIKAIVASHEPDVVVSEYNHTSHDHDHDHDHGEDGDRKTFIRLGVGAVLFAVGFVLNIFFDLPLYAKLAFTIVAYIILGYDVVLRAVKNIASGRVFDENFLMTISTVGAFVIGEYFEAVAVMLFYQVGEMFQDISVDRSRKSIEALMDIRPDRAVVKRNGELLTVSPDEVEVGEEIVVKAGEKLPLDGVVVEGTSMLDTKALTGESVPRSVRVGDEALSGCINQNGVLTVRVTKPFGESTVAKIIDLVENASSRKAPTENFITTFARYYTPIVVLLALLLAVVPPLFVGEWFEWIHRAMVFLVISCPCALVISIPLAFFGGIGAASKHGILVKGSNYLESLNSVTTVVFDKTGTLTKGTFTVTEISPVGDRTKEEVLEYAALAESFSNHPIAKSILTAFGKEVDKNKVKDYKEIAGQGVTAQTDGKKLSVGNKKLMQIDNVEFSPCDKAGTVVYVALDGKYIGHILIGDDIRPDSREAIEKLKHIGVEKTVILTGDEEEVSRSVAAKLNVDEYYAGLLPADKVEKLELLGTKKKGKLAFVGDGINDAPVLALADVGIAMGGLGSDAAIEAADVVLMTDEPMKLVEAVDIAKATKRIVIQNIAIALTVKVLFMILGAFGIAGMWEAVFGDVGVALIAVFNSMRILRK